jgi:hypothetical protein
VRAAAPGHERSLTSGLRVAAAVAQGRFQPEVTAELFLAPRTVEWYRVVASDRGRGWETLS